MGMLLDGLSWVFILVGLFFMIVGEDDLGVYESSWGRDSNATERFGTKASFECGATTKVASSTCP